jgi:hypothetical protein
VRNEEKLHLITNTPQVDVLGAGLVEAKKTAGPYVPPCPLHGPSCKRVAVSIEPLSELGGIPRFEEYTAVDRAWSLMKLLLRQQCVF